MRSVSVIVPVKDGGPLLGEVLARRAAAGRAGADRGRLGLPRRIASTSRGRPAPSVIEIPPDEFGHGRTRNLAAEHSSGELICFLTQDAVPEPGWLDAYRESFELDPRVGAAFGPHLPFADTSPMVARELTEFFAGFSPNGTPALHRRGDLTFLSNVNACYLRRVLGGAALSGRRRTARTRRSAARCSRRAGSRSTSPRAGGPPRPRLRPARLHAPLLRRVPRPPRGERPRRAAATNEPQRAR